MPSAESRRWIALDDDLEDWPAAYRHHLIACDGTKGLSDPSASGVKNMLRSHSTNHPWSLRMGLPMIAPSC